MNFRELLTTLGSYVPVSKAADGYDLGLRHGSASTFKMAGQFARSALLDATGRRILGADGVKLVERIARSYDRLAEEQDKQAAEIEARLRGDKGS